MELNDLFKWVGAAAFILIFLVFAIFWNGFHRGETSKFEQGMGQFCGQIPVPQPYQTIFLKAGEKWKVQPAFIAAIFIAGEHDGGSDDFHFTAPSKWPNADGPWASSPVGASGPFQFMPATWDGHKQDGNGDGVMDIQNLWDSSFAAAELSAMNGAGGNTTDLDNLRDAASRYNSGRPWSKGQGFKETAAYVPRVIEAFQYYYCAAVAKGAWIWPVDGGTITSTFGEQRQGYKHDGLDIAEPKGTPIKVVDGGTVKTVHLGATDNSCGVYVTVQHAGGLNTIYCHMVEGSPTVSEGQTVTQGQIIGQVDSTASDSHSTGHHLHFGVTFNGTKVDPLNYLPKR